MKFQTHTVSQSEVIGNFTPFSQFSHLFFTLFPIFFPQVTTTHHPYLHMKFQTHTGSQSEVIGNFTPFPQFSHLFFTPFPNYFSQVTSTQYLLPTYEISDAYSQSIRSYWQFHTFFLNFHTFFGCGHVKNRCEIYFFLQIV